MRRFQMMLEEEMDAALEIQAAREGTSKAALIRRFVGERITPVPPITDDPLWQLVGSVEGDRNDSSSIDDVLYGQRPDA
ncbi:MAG: hypothetical protein H0V36_00245 [Chloroflexi bacterium]|nr:hypothetical protein [Chloroflexota bacterium]